jgi:predicted  nucleic acid-binding Zn-ribbon protein
MDHEAEQALARADRAEHELALLLERPAALAEKKLVLKARLLSIDAQLKALPAQTEAAREKALRLRRIAAAYQA